MSATIVRKTERELVDALEKALSRCEHPYAKKSGSGWCNVCGATLLSTGLWLKPCWRDLLAPTVDGFFK